MAQDGEGREGRGGGGGRERRRRRRGEGGDRSRAALLVTAEKLDSQSDAFVPLPRQDADVSAVERRLEDVLFVNVVVAVSREDLDGEEQPIRTTHITAAVSLNNSD